MFRPSSLLAPSSPPRSFLPLRILPQGSRGFYVRAYRAPPHAPDMLTVRIQVIDGTGTFTLSDSQPCRLLLCLQSRLLSGSGVAPVLSSRPPYGQEAAKCPEPLCPTSVLPPLGRCECHLLRGRYPSVIAPTGSCATPIGLSPASAFSLVRRVFAGCTQSLLPTGSSRRYL